MKIHICDKNTSFMSQHFVNKFNLQCGAKAQVFLQLQPVRACSQQPHSRTRENGAADGAGSVELHVAVRHLQVVHEEAVSAEENPAQLAAVRLLPLLCRHKRNPVNNEVIRFDGCTRCTRNVCYLVQNCPLCLC